MKDTRGSRGSERKKQLIEGYVPLWKKGMAPIEIAKYFKVSRSTMYRCLQEIADKNNLKRDVLLEKKSGPHIMTSPKNSNYCKIEIDKIEEEYTKMYKASNSIVQQIDCLCEKVKGENVK